MTTLAVEKPHDHPTAVHLMALVGGNVALAMGPLFVRLGDAGPVSAGFWRLFLALPLLALLARGSRQPLFAFNRRELALVAIAGIFFALDLASWHIGIERTRLGNAALFGNCGSVILMVWGLVAMRRRPRAIEVLAVVVAIAGAAVLLGRSLEIGARTLAGDLFCIVAGLLYVVYILVIQQARGRFGGWSLLFLSSLAGCPILIVAALAMGEPFWPHVWWPQIALMLASQVVGQGLLVYSLRHVPPLVVGLALLTQPVVSVLVGWLAFAEVLSPFDMLGMVMVGAALVMARLADRAPA